MKRIVLTGGGTAGHVSPNQALIPHLLEEGWDIHYIGTKNGIERTLIEPMQGVTYHAVSSGKLRRYFDWKNFTDPFRVIAGAFQSIGVIGRLKPNVVFSKGGFVSVPVRRGHLRRAGGDARKRYHAGAGQQAVQAVRQIRLHDVPGVRKAARPEGRSDGYAASRADFLRRPCARAETGGF